MKKPEFIIGIILFIAVVGGGIFILSSGQPESGDYSDNENYPMYKEIVNPAGFVNGEPFKISDYVGKKVILLDFVTYSCINCQRTFPYLVDWYSKYKDDGLLIIGIHTPEFAFEHNIENVRRAMREWGIEFPIVLDNDYATWNAYGNHYWPRKYLINADGKIVYDHIGEGAYEETEAKIVELLSELNNKKVEMEKGNTSISPTDFSKIGSPETYLGSKRLEYINNLPDNSCLTGSCDYVAPKDITLNTFSLDGRWRLEEEKAVLESESENAGYDAQKDEIVENMLARGIIDPVKVARTALENASSASAIFLTTEVAIADLPEEKKEMSGGPDMSGMGY